jgi:hypothetical protein
MSTIIPEGEDLHRAIKWISAHLQEEPDQPLKKLIHDAIFKYDLSPRDSDFLINFYSNARKAD